MINEQVENQNCPKRRIVEQERGTGVQGCRGSWQWLCRPQHSEGLGEGHSQLGVAEFHFIVKACFSKDCCALCGYDGM